MVLKSFIPPPTIPAKPETLVVVSNLRPQPSGYKSNSLSIMPRLYSLDYTIHFELIYHAKHGYFIYFFLSLFLRKILFSFWFISFKTPGNYCSL